MTTNKKPATTQIVVVLLSLVVIAAILFLVILPKSQGNNTLTIGMVLPLTGDAGTFGQNTVRGAQLAVRDAESLGLITKGSVVLIQEDSKGQAKEAVSAARKLISVNGADSLIGDVTSAGTQAIIPIITETMTPTISPSASDPALSGASPMFARVWPSDDYEAVVIASHARSIGFERIVVIYANTDYGVAMLDEFRDAVTPETIAASIPVDRESLNLRPVIQRVADYEPDAIFVVLYPEDWKRILQQMREANLDLPILATATFEDPELLLEENASGVVFASPQSADEDTAARQAFIAEYQASYGEPPGVLSDTGYDAAMIIMKAHSSSENPTAESIMTFIKGLSDYDGLSGKMSFDSNGDVQKPYALKTVREGGFTWLTE